MKFRVLEENNNEIQRRFREVKLIYKTIYAMNDEGAWNDSLWLIPDGADEEDLREYFALDEEDFKELVDMFNDVYKDYHEGGLYNASLEVENYAHKKDKELGLSPIVNLKPKTRVTEGETKAEIEKTADRLNYPKSQIVKSDKGNYFLAPRGIEKTGAKKAYANCREKSEDKEKCSKIAWSVEKKNEGLDTDLKELEETIKKEEILTEGVWFLPFKQADVDEIKELLKEPITYQELLDSPVAIIGSDEFYDKLEDNIVDNPDEDAREFIKQELSALVKDYRANEKNYREKATEEILKQLEELDKINETKVKVEKKQIKVTEEKDDLGNELVKYKGYDIVEFTGYWVIDGKKIDAHNWGIVGGYVKIGDVNVPMTLKITNEQDEIVKFETVEDAKNWIDKFDGKFNIELENGDELTAVIKDEYKQEIEDEKLNEEIKEINKEDCKTVFLTNEELKSKAQELAEKLDPTEYLDETYQDYRDFINKELSNKVLDEAATEQEKNELVKWFEESYEKKTKVAKRLFGEGLQEFNEKYKTDEAIFEGLEDDLFRDDKIDSSWANIEVKADSGNFEGEMNLGGEQNLLLNPQTPQVVNMLPNNTMNLGTKVDEFEQMQYQMLQQSLQNPNLPLQPNISAPMTNIQLNPQLAPQVPNFAFNNLNNVSAVRKDDGINMQIYGQNPVANFAPNPNINNNMNVGNQNVIDEFVDDRMARDDEF